MNAPRPGGLAASRLRRLAQPPQAPPPDAPEQCELCAAPVPPEHRHLLDLEKQRLLCACRACTILFDRQAAGGEHYRLIPDRRWILEDFALEDALWEGLRIPVDMAFLFRSTPAERMVAFYPGPMGATESLLELETWEQIEAGNPVLGELEPDVEALLVNRARGAREYWVVPVDDCYRLAGLIRMRWKGLSGGQEVWAGIGQFFAELRERAKRVRSDQGAAAAPR